MIEHLDTLGFPLELSDDYKRARSLEGIMRAIEETLHDADDSTQCQELIDVYLGAYGEHNSLTDAVEVTGRSLSAYEPSRHMVDLVTAATSES